MKKKRIVEFMKLTIDDFNTSIKIKGVPSNLKLNQESLVDVEFEHNAETPPLIAIWNKLSTSQTVQTILPWIAVYIKIKNNIKSLSCFRLHWNETDIVSVYRYVIKQDIYKKDLKAIYKKKDLKARYKLSYISIDDFVRCFNDNSGKGYNSMKSVFTELQSFPYDIFREKFVSFNSRYIPKDIVDMKNAISKHRKKIIAIQGTAGTGKSYTTVSLIKKLLSKHETNAHIVVSSLSCKRMCEFAKDLVSDEMVATHCTIDQFSFARLNTIQTSNSHVFEDNKLRIAIIEEASLLDMTNIGIFKLLLDHSHYVIMNGDSLYQHNSFLNIGDLFMLTCVQLLNNNSKANRVSDVPDNVDDCLGKVIYLTYPYRCKTENAVSVFNDAMQSLRNIIKSKKPGLFDHAWSPLEIHSLFHNNLSRFDKDVIIDRLSSNYLNEAIITITNEMTDEMSSRIMSTSLSKGNDVWKHCYLRKATDNLYNKEPVTITNTLVNKEDRILHIFVESVLRPDQKDEIIIKDCDSFEDAMRSKKLFSHIIHSNVSTIFSSQGNTYDRTYIILEKLPKGIPLNFRSLYVALTRHRYETYINISSDVLLEYDMPFDRVYDIDKPRIMPVGISKPLPKREYKPGDYDKGDR